MMKRGYIVWLLVVIIVFTMVGCSITPNTSVETTLEDGNENIRLEFTPKGTYVKWAFGEEFWIYRFASPNSTIVVYKTIDGIYLIGEGEGEKGISYGNIFVPQGEFIGISNKYLLFERDGVKVAVSIERRKKVKEGESFYEEYLFEELTEEETRAFVYPIECKKVKN